MANKVDGVAPFQGVKELKTSVEQDKNQVLNQDKKNCEHLNVTEDLLFNKESEVVYDNSKKFDGLSTYNKKGKPLDPKTIEAMKSEAEKHYSKMIESIKQMIIKQGYENGASLKKTEILNISYFNISSEKLEFIETETDIDNSANYWSAEATAERIVNFAKEISGGDTSKYETLKKAIQKGFDKAISLFDKTPEISQKTFDLAMKGLDSWAKSKETASSERNDKTPQ